MAVSAKVGSFLSGTGAAGTTVVVTGVGFQPKLVLFWTVGRSDTSDAVGRAGHVTAFGAAASTTQRAWVASSANDAAAAAVAAVALRNDSAIGGVAAAGGYLGYLDLQSFDSDGFTLVVDSAFPTTRLIQYLALGGDSITNVAVGTFQEPAVTGTQDITGLGFQPDSLLILNSTRATSIPGNSATNAGAGIGATDGTNTAMWLGGTDSGAATMISKTYCRAGEIIGLPANNYASITARAEFSSFLSDGFRLNWLERNLARFQVYVAIKGASVRVGNFLTQTDTTTAMQQTGFGFAPVAVLLMSAGAAATTQDGRTADDRLSIGAATSTSERLASAHIDVDAVADSIVGTAVEFDSVYVNLSDAAAVEGAMDVQSFDSDGFTTIMTDADPAQSFVWYMAFGASSAPPPSAAGYLTPMRGIWGD